MRARILLFVLLAAGLTGAASAQVTQEWVVRYNGPGNNYDTASSLAVDGNGNVYVTGYSTGSGTGLDYATIKYNSVGVQQWASRYNGPGNGDDYALSLAVDGNGNVYVTGYSTGSGTGTDYATIKYTSAGVQQWVARYNGPANSDDYAVALAVDGNGNVYVTGYSDGGTATGPDYATIKYNAAGVQQWAARYNGPANSGDEAYSLAVDGNGNVYVTGFSSGIGTYGDYATIKYNSSGVQQWVAYYNGPGNGYDVAKSLAVDGNGNVYVTGGSSWNHYPIYPYNYDYATIKYNSAGVQQWASRYNGPANNDDIAISLAVDNHGNVYVTGTSFSNPFNLDYATIKYNAAGVELWVARYNGPGNDTDEANCLVVDGDGNVYVTGYSAGSWTHDDYATIKYNTAGQQQWVARYNGPANGWDEARSLAIDGNGNVYVTGSSDAIAFSDYATIKYIQLQLDVTLTPINPPIVIPVNGGSLNFNASVVNRGPAQTPFFIWTRDWFPDGSYTPNLLGPIRINPLVGATVSRLRTQAVPSSWPAGLHYYIAYAGLTASYPAIDADSFSWTKSATADSRAWVTEASCTGEPFPGEALASGEIHPSSFILHPCSPNPFNTTTDIRYQIPDTRNVSLRVYDTAGRLVTTLADGWQQMGTHSVTFDGSALASGIYLARLQTREFSAVEKLVLMK